MAILSGKYDMHEINSRSLNVPFSELGKRDTDFVLKYTCSLQGCGGNFEVRISKYDYDRKAAEKRKYSARCNCCMQKFMLTESQSQKFKRLFGCEVRIVENTFTTLFSIDDDQ